MSKSILCFETEYQKNAKTIVDFKYQGSKPERGLLWIMDYASGWNINENDVEKECVVVFSRSER